MGELDVLVAQYQAGEAISFGPQVTKAGGVRHLHGLGMPPNTLKSVRPRANSDAQVRRLGWDQVRGMQDDLLHLRQGVDGRQENRFV